MLCPFSCRGRNFCPSCEKKKQLLWAEWLQKEVLATVPHRHVVVTMPRLLRGIFRKRRELLLDLSQCAAESLAEYMKRQLGADTRPGTVVSIATSGDLLQWHPHGHLFVTDGAFSGDGAFHPIETWDADAVMKLFRERLLARLIERHAISEDLARKLLAWRHPGLPARCGSGASAARSLGRTARNAGPQKLRGSTLLRRYPYPVWGRMVPPRDEGLVGARADTLVLPVDLGQSTQRPDPRTVELLRLARGGDQDAFATLVERHERMVLRTALRLLGRLDAAQDAAQETFLRLFKHLGRFDESRELGPWLYRVVVNVCRDAARSTGSRRWLGLDAAEERTATVGRPASNSIEETLFRNERFRLLQAALSTLPERERAALVLRDLEGLASPMVARILGSSEGTVRSQVASARLKIKRFMEAHMEKRP